MLRFYVEMARTAFRQRLVYRWATLVDVFINIFWCTFFSYIYLALFRTRPVTANYDARDILRYIWLAQALTVAIVPNGWNQLMLTIRTGEVISDLSKPCDFYWYWFSRELGRSCYALLFQSLPTYIAGMLLFGYGWPQNWSAWTWFIVSLFLGVTLGIVVRVIPNLTAFWLIEVRGIITLVNTVALFFTGGYVPLALFPLWLHSIADWLPFNGLLNVPIETLLGKVSGNALLLELALQAGWLLILTFGVHLLTSVAARRVSVQGG